MLRLSDLFAVRWYEVAEWPHYEGVAQDPTWPTSADSPIFAELVNKVNATTVIEVGSWQGRSAVKLGQALMQRWQSPDGTHQPRLYCVDTWQGGIDHLLSDHAYDHLQRDNGYPMPLYRHFLQHIYKAGLYSIVQPIVCPSSIGALLLKAHDIKADLVYIDADHTEQGAFADMDNYWPLVRPGGVMFGDDTQMEGVAAAYKRFTGHPVNVNERFWAMQKPA